MNVLINNNILLMKLLRHVLKRKQLIVKYMKNSKLINVLINVNLLNYMYQMDIKTMVEIYKSVLLLMIVII